MKRNSFFYQSIEFYF